MYHKSKGKISKINQKEKFVEKLQIKDGIKQVLSKQCKQKRSDQDRINNVRTFLEIYNKNTHKKRTSPKLKIKLKKVR